MKTYTLKERAEFYSKTFPNWPPLRADDRWLDGMWILGNDYRGSGYYGSYPPNYLKRVMSIFPDAENILHLFSGSLVDVKGKRLDLKEPADYVGDAHNLSEIVTEKFDLILADPPYSAEDAEHYGTPMIRRGTVFKQCYSVLEVGGYIVWLDQVLPQFTKQELHLCGVIGIVRSTNHRFRVVSIFKKVGDL